MKINKHIEIVRSATPSLSSMGELFCEMIRTTLKRHYRTVGVTLISNIRDLENLVLKQPDLVFLGLKNMPATTSSEHIIWIAAYLDDHDINHTGSVASAIALDFDKPMAKRAVQAAGLLTSSFFVADAGEYTSETTLPITFPLFVKPPHGGGGKGIGADSVVRDFAGLAHKIQAIAAEFQTYALVEKYLPGREFSVAILDDAPSGELTIMPIELVTAPNSHGDRILGQSIKAADTEHVIAVSDATLRHTVATFAQSIFVALGARDYGRIDIRLDESGIPHFLEANLIPGLAPTSYFVRACQINQSLGYEAMILQIVATGLSRDQYLNENTATSEILLIPA